MNKVQSKESEGDLEIMTVREENIEFESINLK